MGSDPFNFDNNAAAGQPAHGDEDLFAFDEMLQSTPKTKQSLAAELDAALTEVASARGEVVRASAESLTQAPRLRADDGGSLRTPRDLTYTSNGGAVAAAAARRAAPAVARNAWAPSRALIALVAVFVAINATTSVLAWRSAAGTRAVIGDLGERWAATTLELRAENARTVPRSADEPRGESRAIDEGFGTIENARAHIERGEFERARRTLGGLLAVIDRFDASRRAEIEAQAGFVVAESYQRQALLAQRVGGEQ